MRESFPVDQAAADRTMQISAGHAVLRVRPQQFLYFFPLPQGHGALRGTFSSRLRIGSIFCGRLRAVDRRLLLLAHARRCAGGASSWIAADSVHVLPTKFSSSCSILKIRSVT